MYKVYVTTHEIKARSFENYDNANAFFKEEKAKLDVVDVVVTKVIKSIYTSDTSLENVEELNSRLHKSNVVLVNRLNKIQKLSSLTLQSEPRIETCPVCGADSSQFKTEKRIGGKVTCECGYIIKHGM